MAFTFNDDRWPYISTLAWIVSRSATHTVHMGQFPLARADEWRAGHNAYVGTGLMRDSLANAKGELSNALALRKLTGEGTRLLRIYKRQNRFSCSLEAETVEAGCAFPPADDLNILERLKDANDANDDALLYQPVEGEEKEFSVTDWRDLTFARGDIRRLWPEHSCAVAYRGAREHPWSEPPQVDKAVLEKLKGLRPSLDTILSTFAPGGDLAERFRAVHWLCDQARDGRVTIYGSPAQPRLYPTNPIEVTGPSAAIDPGDFNDDALTLSACDPPVANALGASEFAARFAECVNAADAVKWSNVTVDLAGLKAISRVNMASNLKRGRKSKSYWPSVYAEVARLMEENGPFSDDDPDWNHKAQLEETIADFISNRHNDNPAESTIRTHIDKALENIATR